MMLHGSEFNRTRRKFISLMSSGTVAMAICPSLAFSAITTRKTATQNIGSEKGTTGLLFDDRYLSYSAGEWHPESPERLIAVRNRLEKGQLFKRLYRIHPLGNPKKYIAEVHPQSHRDLIRPFEKDRSVQELAVAGVLRAVDAVCNGNVKNAFCVIRPPGHHAADKGFAGFCYYNNVAIAARYAQLRYKMKRVLIVDWDYHHGNGTEWAFYSDPTVLFFSTHALYAYPNTGKPEKTGEGAGMGFNINVPLRHNAGDNEIITAFKEQLLPAAEAFKPDIVLISAGFDSRMNDVLGDFTITDDGFIEMTKMVMDIAERYSNSRIVSVLEGGYNPEGLASAVEAHVRTLMAT